MKLGTPSGLFEKLKSPVFLISVTVERSLPEANPISLVIQSIDPPSPSPPGECVPPAFVVGGGHTRRVEGGMGGQYFGRREK